MSASPSHLKGYLLAAALVTVTASSLGLVSAVPLTREGAGPARAARHVVVRC